MPTLLHWRLELIVWEDFINKIVKPYKTEPLPWLHGLSNANPVGQAFLEPIQVHHMRPLGTLPRIWVDAMPEAKDLGIPPGPFP